MSSDRNTQTVSLPVHEALLVVEPLDYPNPYDFHALHRHDYFELIITEEGSGRQLIDFAEHTLNSGQIAIVYPGQVHLMNRESAQGSLIQFKKELFGHLHPLLHTQLYYADPVFNFEPEEFTHLADLTRRIGKLISEERTELHLHKACSYLRVILLSLAEARSGEARMAGHDIVTEFLYLLPSHIRTERKVSDYASMLGCGTDKLTDACRHLLDKTPLQLIHEECLLEIKRLLLLGRSSLKEIAFDLGFDSQANFSGFIRTRTGLTPSELQQAVREIYKR